MRLASSLVLLAAVAGCVAPPAEPPPPPPRAAPAPPPPAPAPPPASDWRDWPLTAGTWRYLPGRRAAEYGAPGQARLTMTCDRGARTVTLAPLGDAPLTIRTSSTARTVRPEGGAAILPATDPLLDAMAFSRGRFVVESRGAAPLVLPTYAEIGRVIEDCRG